MENQYNIFFIITVMEPKEPRRERYEEKKGLKSSKDEEEEAKRDLEVELEWKAKRNEVNMGKICVSRDAAARRICNGLKMYVQCKCLSLG